MNTPPDQHKTTLLRATPSPWQDNAALAHETRAQPASDHIGGILWITGLSGSGKTTLAKRLQPMLTAQGCRSFVLDGDLLRETLNSDLGFSPQDRHENVRRAGEVAGLFASAGTIAIAAFISPYRADRDRIRARHGASFHEIYLSTPLEVCEARDAKGLYARARRGEIEGFTGIAAPYEPPLQPELALDTSMAGREQCLAGLLRYVRRAFFPRQSDGRSIMHAG